MSASDRRQRFRDLHEREGIFVMPNAFDAGSARLLDLDSDSRRSRPRAPASPGASAAGDQQMTRDELVAHVRRARGRHRAAALGRWRAWLCRHARRGGRDGAAARRGRCGRVLDRGLRPAPTDAIDAVGAAAERVGRGRGRRPREGLVLTARAENLLHGVDDLEDTIARLQAYPSGRRRRRVRAGARVDGRDLGGRARGGRPGQRADASGGAAGRRACQARACGGCRPGRC